MNWVVWNTTALHFVFVIDINETVNHVKLVLAGLKTLIIYIRGFKNKFPDFFRIGAFIDGTHMKL